MMHKKRIRRIPGVRFTEVALTALPPGRAADTGNLTMQKPRKIGAFAILDKKAAAAGFFCIFICILAI